ncbi:tetratricopeptide repeat protein [Roseiconus lacunae]|uniref:protein O-GlcNAc transferase n=1 Tax=Roseiconus lacunae TaxID=2605694 RepID=A0ABT7PE74_9BACT|nr:tetratricopeptide repeat protein [Roseiconus lacunae]MDM4014584.1 tetratricopeptide repeat protein [Roseiconus lacunae]
MSKNSSAKQRRRKLSKSTRAKDKSTQRYSDRQTNPTSQASGNLAGRIETALRYQRDGQLEAAKRIYCEVLAQDPTNADAWHLLGMTLYSGASYHEALECLQKARQFGEDRVDLIGHLALVHHALGQSAQAVKLMAAVVEADPTDAEALNNLGVLLLESGDAGQAQQCFEKAIELRPGYGQAIMNLANALSRLNRLHDAEPLYRELIRENPQAFDVMGNLGECLRRQGRWEEALEVLEKVVAGCPTDQVARLTHARTLSKLDRLEEAKSALETIVRDFPNCAKAYHYLGETLMKIGNVSAAEVQLEQSLRLSPDDPHTLCTMGFAHIAADRRADALECMAKAVRIDPTFSEADECLLYLMTGDPSINPQELYEAHVRWGKRHSSRHPKVNHANNRDPNRKLRIGYASADFREHAVAVFFEPLVRLRDKDRFETFCYYECGINDRVTQKLRSMADHWRQSLGYSDQQLNQQVIDDEIDILVDLSGHTSGNRLVAWSMKPAPIQISWLGYPNTSGVEAIDYTFSCDIMNPPDEPSYHTEQLLRIPGGSFSFRPPENAPELSPSPLLKKGHVTFGSFHRPFKVSSKTHDHWAAALHACPEATLIAFNTWFNDRTKHELRAALVDRGIESDRIEIRNTYRGDSYLSVYDEIDIGLDATPWAGGTTTMEALWMGIPVIAIYGNNRPSRGTAGIVHHLGYPDWVAHDEREYAEKVRSLASDQERLVQLRQTLREQTRRTIADEQRFVTEVEKAYRKIWNQWCASAPLHQAIVLPQQVTQPLVR